jgi:hypothetical protein
MTFTGTLIEDLMAAVERVEQRTHSDEPLFAKDLFAKNLFAEASFAEAWFAAMPESADYDSKLLGVA